MSEETSQEDSVEDREAVRIERRKPLWVHFLKALPAILLAMLLTYVASHVGLLPDLEALALDTQMRFNRAPDSSQVAIVRITDDDYKSLFHEKSPLDPAPLQKILEAILKGNPTVVGVDIDTSGSEFQPLENLAAGHKIIWARSAKEVAPGLLQPEFVLGRERPAACSGLTVTKEDPDRVLRHYRRSYDKHDLSDPRICEKLRSGESPDARATTGAVCAEYGCPLPALPWAIFQAYREQTGDGNQGAEGGKSVGEKDRGDEEEELAIRFARARPDAQEMQGGGRFDVTAQETLDLAEIVTGAQDGQKFKHPFEGKIVLLGGSYEAARDKYETSLGQMNGVEIIAQIIETELQGGGIPPPNWPVVFLLLIFDNFLLILIFQHFRSHLLSAVMGSLVAIFVMALICSLLAFHSLALWIYFVPLLVAILIHELYDIAQDYRKEAIGHLYHNLREAPQAAGSGVADSPDETSFGKSLRHIALKLSRRAGAFYGRLKNYARMRQKSAPREDEQPK